MRKWAMGSDQYAARFMYRDGPSRLAHCLVVIDVIAVLSFAKKFHASQHLNDDLLIIVEDGYGELVGTQISPHIFHRVEFRGIGRRV